MIRTYRSKKETGGGLDHKDLIQNLDEKSSAFDAFYIQNIKQTKRELSCVGSSNPYSVASNRVSKRKYVRRLKEVDTRPRDSFSKSSYLTPDKSLRVNKPLDPFDLLLNSSPASTVDAAGDKAWAVSRKHDLFNETVAKKESKTYRRKRLIKAKKYNFSSSETDSDKENSDEKINITKNTSDIKTHQLLIEQQASPCPNQCDDSINKIVKNISLLNRLQLKNSFNESMRKSLRYNRNRLTNNIQSPILQKSPLCSTPFKSKYRGDSIFKFSPISVTVDEGNPTCIPIAEDDNNSSVIFMGKDISTRIDRSNTQCPIKNITTNNSIIECNMVDEVLEPNTAQINMKVENETVEKDLIDSKIVLNDEISSCQITEIEPFMGFSDSEINKLDNIKNELATKIANGDTIPKIEINETICEGYDEIVNEEDALPDNDVTKEGHESIVEENNEIIKPHIVFNESIEANNENSISSSIDSDKSDVNDSLSESSGKESFYDTCSSDRSSVNSKFVKREPVIQIERMNDSAFLRYYEKMPVYESDKESDIDSNDSLTKDSEEFASFNSSKSSQKDKSLEENIENYLSINETDVYSCTDSDPSEDDDLEYDNDSDEKCVSFVTTRRRNEVTNNSIMSIFDTSNGSSNTQFDKTVLSNSNVTENTIFLETNDTLYKFDTNESIGGSNDETVCNETISKNDLDAEFAEEEAIISYKTTKTSPIAAKKSSFRSRKTIQHQDNENPRPIDRLLKSGSKESLHSAKDKLVENSSCKDTISKADTEFAEDDTRMSFITTRKSSTAVAAARKSSIATRENTASSSRCQIPKDTRNSTFDIKQGIVLQPGKKWERSLSIYRRMTMMTDHFDHSILEDEAMEMKGRKYRQSVLSTMEMQDFHGSLHNESINSRRSTFVSKPSRSTIRIVKDPSISRLSVCNTTVFDDLKGFLNEECDDTIVDLSKLSIADPTHEVTVIDNFHDTSNRIATARDYVLRRCNQTDAILFDECYPERVLKNCRKIGEGVYGEVFLWRARDGRARVLKIVPIAGSIKVNGESQKDYHEIISEIVIAMELSALRAPIAEIQRHFDEGKEVDALDLHAIENATDVFNEVLAVRCVYGNYPLRLLDLWDLYDECKGSENDNPAILPVDQQYIVLELANAGQDLESYEFNNAEQAHALFLQVAYGLAVGEEAFQFEHRDLHWGNVLIAPTEQKLKTFVLRGRAHRVPCCGAAATIIDYSLSRVALPLAGDSAALYNDLAADDSLFDAVGDYQFEVYRLMREKLGNDWKNFEPYTNILWLHYTVDKMITALRYKRTNTKIHKHYIEKLKGIKDRILGYDSAALFVLTDNEI